MVKKNTGKRRTADGRGSETSRDGKSDNPPMFSVCSKED